MSGNTFGTLFAVTNFGESHGPAIGCVIDGCPPGMALSRSRHPARPGPPPPRHQPPRDAAPRRRQGGDPLGRVRRARPPARRSPADPQHRPAQQGLPRDRAEVPARPRRLHLPAEIRPARSARRRALVGAPDGAHGRGRRGGQEVAARRSTAPCFAAACSRSATSRSRSRAGSTCRTTRSSRRSPTCRALEAYMDACARPATPAARASASRASGVPVGPGRAAVRQAGCRHRLRDDGHQRGQGRGDRRRLRQRRRSAAPRTATRSRRRASPPTTRAACWAASAPARTWKCRSRSSRPARSSRPRETIDVHGQPIEVVTKGRHDPCVGIRATPIAEAMLALVVMEHALRHRAQNGDVKPPIAPIESSFL